MPKSFDSNAFLSRNWCFSVVPLGAFQQIHTHSQKQKEPLHFTNLAPIFPSNSYLFSGWCFQPISKILVNWIISPNRDEHKKNISNHHPVLLFLLIPVAFHTKASVIAHGQKVPRRHGRVIFPPNATQTRLPTLNRRHCPLCQTTKKCGFFFEDGYPPLKPTLAPTRKPLQKEHDFAIPNFQQIC